MKCIDKDCPYRRLHGGDDDSDFYYCKEVGVEVGRGQDECILDKYAAMDQNREDSQSVVLSK